MSPVLVTGAEQPAARLLAALLVAGGGEVRVFVDLERPDRADPDVFRALGCKVAQGALDDEGHLEAACEQVHTVVHLAVDPLRDEVLVEHAAAVVSAAVGAGVRRLVVASDLVLDQPEVPDGLAGWVAALHEVEELAADLPGETLVLRRALGSSPDEPLLRSAAGAAVQGEVDLGGLHHALAASDLARTIAAWDAERTGGGDGEAILRLRGPVEVTAEALITRALPGGPPLTPTARALLAATVTPPASALAGATPPLPDG